MTLTSQFISKNISLLNIGLYFGSFNPIHTGHLIIANHVLNYSDLNTIWFVVTPQNPFKETSSLLNENHRKHLVDLAVEDNPQMKSSNIEFLLPRPSYTIDTLVHLEEKYPRHRFTVLVGSDSFLNIPRWKNGKVLLQNYDIIIYQRPGSPVDQSSITKNMVLLDAPLLQISSSYIRKLIKERKSIQYLVPDIVREEILTQQFYF